jgi:hypothetical protein
VIEMIEPTDPAERALAIRICRLNAHLKPEDGTPETDPEVSKKLWQSLPDLDYAKWLWIWNHARAEWDGRPAISDGDL